ncbi:hypothetical protein [Bacillus sp. JJ1474]|uniref:hypothetical protein n=1 Tax=Bacillus sp. JJ1474 TaxID=3122955 RepID=UPI00300081F3
MSEMGMITLVGASSLEELNNKLNEIKVDHETRNPHREVVVEVVSPDPKTVTFKSYEATSFSVSVKLNKKDDEE